MNKFLRNKGFTLIELLVVVAIIGLLSSVVLASLNTARTKANDAARISGIRQLQSALEFYYDKYGSYPNSGWVRSCDATWVTSLGVAMIEFIPTMPKDPTNDCAGYAYSGYKNYSYFATGYYPVGGVPGQWYMIVYTLENNNSQLDASNSSTDCVGNVRNYGGQDGYIITEAGNCIK